MNAPPVAGDAAVMARAGRSFWLASRVLSARDATDAATLYAFCRRADDLADEAIDPAARAAAVERLCALADAIASGDRGAPELAPLFALNDRGRLALAPLERLVRALAADCGPQRIADDAALLAYAYGVAGTVGEVMAALLGANDARASAHAIDLGVAMQLTNIARDVIEDAGRERIYLPQSWPDAADAARGIANDRDASSAARLWPHLVRLLDLADRYYQSAALGYRYLPPRARLAVVAAAELYRAIGTTILSRGPARYARGRTIVGRPRKLATLALSVIVWGVARDAKSPSTALAEGRWHAFARS